MVSVLTFVSEDPSLNNADAYIFSVELVLEKNENEQKEAWVGPSFKKHIALTFLLHLIILVEIVFARKSG